MCAGAVDDMESCGLEEEVSNLKIFSANRK